MATSSGSATPTSTTYWPPAIKGGHACACALAELRAVLRLTEEIPPFRDCGKDAAQDDNYRIAISMKGYANAIDMVGISAQRHEAPKARIADQERPEAESIIGALGWSRRQLRADAAFGYSLMAQRKNEATAAGLIGNKLVAYARETAATSLVFRPIGLRI